MSTVEDIDDLEFDFDDLYKDLPKNSDNPINTEQAEIVEDTGCAGGACTL